MRRDRSSLRAGWALSLVVGIVAAFQACGGSNSPTPLPTPVPSVPAPTPTPTPVPSATPTPVAANCPLGKGTASASCARHNGQFVSEIDAAVSQVMRENPGMFDMGDPANPRVRDSAAYYAAVVRSLQAAGFCANYDGAEVQVKNTNDFSEQYDVLLSDGAVRRGSGAYRLTCQPASFPLDPEDVIDSVRVAFYGIRCLDGQTKPNNGLGLLPIDCIGFVTATPKNRENRDVPAAVHGPTIAWILKEGAEHVRVDEEPNQDFNKNVTARSKGHFTLCATVKGVEGCLHGEVVD
jgi:hypothetical protein